jgi:hypothetical protein
MCVLSVCAWPATPRVGSLFPFVLHEKIRKAGQISVPVTAFLLYSTMKKGETFSQASIGNKSVKKSRNESDLENSASLVTLFILAPKGKISNPNLWVCSYVGPFWDPALHGSASSLKYRLNYKNIAVHLRYSHLPMHIFCVHPVG